MRETRLVLVGLCLLAAVACTSAPDGIVWATGSGSQTQDGLQRVRWSDLGDWIAAQREGPMAPIAIQADKRARTATAR